MASFPEAERRIEEIRLKAMDTLLTSRERYPDPAVPLAGIPLLDAASEYATYYAFVAERVLEIRQTPTATLDAAERDELWYLDALLVLAHTSLVPYLELSATAFGIDPSPFCRCFENLTPATRADAKALATRLQLLAQSGVVPSVGLLAKHFHGAAGRAPDVEDAEPTRPTTSDLATAAGVSNETLGRVRDAAKIEWPFKGGAARNQRYTPAQVDRLIGAALAGTFLERKAMAEKWAQWGSK